MTIERAIRLLVIEYERAIKLDFVKNPVAYALYNVWKIADKQTTKRSKHEETDT